MAKREKAEIYRLYAFPTNQKNVNAAIRYRFNRITPTYILVYDKKEKPQNCVEIKEKDVFRLTRQDKDWLMSCCIAQLSEVINRSQEETFQKMDQIIRNLENELKIEAEAEKRGDTETNGKEPDK